MIKFTQIKPRLAYSEKFYHQIVLWDGSTYYRSLNEGHFREKESLSDFKLEFILFLTLTSFAIN